MTTRPTFHARRVIGTLRGGSSRPLLVETDAGRFVVKLIHGPDGPLALAADWLGTALASALGLPTLELALILVETDLAVGIVESELREAVERGAGLSLGSRALSHVASAQPTDLAEAQDDFALRVLWLDILIQNHDRTHRNPNILKLGASLLPIDHGAAFSFHHDWHVTEELPGLDVAPPVDHVFANRVSRLSSLSPFLASALDRTTLENACESIPDAWLGTLRLSTPHLQKTAYAAFLWKRLRAMRDAFGARLKP